MCECDRSLPSSDWRACVAYGSSLYATSVKTAAAAFSNRDGARLVYFNSKWWILGGWWPPANGWSATEYTTNEVWSSSDLITWTLELAHVTSPPTIGAGARWKPRHTFMTFVHAGKLWVAGSDQYDALLAGSPGPVASDVWSSVDGTTWVRVAASSPWGAGAGVWDPIPATFGGYMHVLGGHRASGGQSYSDYLDWAATAQHWRSSDGVSWEQLADMPFNRAKVMDAVGLCGKMFVIGGNSGTSNVRVQPSDVWAWNGGSWRRMSSDSKGLWSGRDYVSIAAFDNKLWVSTGYNKDAGNSGGVTWSRDLGVTWERHPTPTWSPSHADGFAVGPQGLALGTGNQQAIAVHLLAIVP